MKKILENISEEKKIFYIFLLVHLVVWTVIGLVRTVLPTDSLEGIYWGSLHDFGTPKHPPLAGWLTYLAYIPFKSDFCVYLLSQAFIILGFVYIYRLAKKFLNDVQAMLSVIILEGTWCYSYVTCYYGFNPDVILLFTLPAIAFYFYNCLTKDNNFDWIKLGLLVGFSFLNKYQTALVIFPMLILAIMYKRQIFKNKYFYFAIMIAFLIFLPHLIWLIKYDFYPLMYFEGELTASGWWNHISAPFMFFVMQIVAIIGTLLIFALSKIKFKSNFLINKNYDKKDFWFLMLIGFMPLAVHILMGLIEGGTMRPRWGYEFWFMSGIMLYYFFPFNINKESYKFTVKLAYVVMGIVFLVMGTLLTVEKNYRSRYPVASVFNDFKDIWAQKYDTPIKYLGGYIEWTLPITIYGDTHPKCILDNHGYKDPWISQDELKKYGVLVIDRKPEGVRDYTRLSCPYLPEDFEINPVEYKFTLYNALKMPREYTVYYFIVPPVKDFEDGQNEIRQ